MATVCLGLHLPSASRLWRRYNNALRHAPLATKSLTCMAAYSFGDVAAQVAFSKQQRIVKKIADIDGLRVLRMALYGALWCGPVGHHFYAGLDKIFHAQPLALTIAGKVGLDQLLYAPISTAAFFAWLNLASGTVANTPSDLAEKLAPSVKAAWALWVPAMTINMALVPPDVRILFINATAIVWTMVLSSMADNGATSAPDAAPLPAEDVVSLAATSVASAPAVPEVHPLTLDADCDADSGVGGGVVGAVWHKLMHGGTTSPRRTSGEAKQPVKFLFDWPCLDVMQMEEVPNRMLRSISTFGSMRNAAVLDDLDLCVPETPNGEDPDGSLAGGFETYASQNLVDVLEECLP